MIFKSVLIFIFLCFQIQVLAKKGPPHGHKNKERKENYKHVRNDGLAEVPVVPGIDFNNLYGSSGSRLIFKPTINARGLPVGKPEEKKKNPWDENAEEIIVPPSTIGEAQNTCAGKHIIRTDHANFDREDDTGQRSARIQIQPTRRPQESLGQDEAEDEVTEDIVNLPMTAWQQPRNAILAEQTDPDDSGEVVNAFIMGGEETEISHYPFVVSLQYKNLHQCGGVIINSRTILTAAHCLTDMSKSLNSWNVVAGRTYHNEGTSGQVIGVQVVEQHPGYTHTRKTMTNDLGMIWLKDSLKWTEHVQPAKLVEAWGYGKDQLVTVIGWGRTSSVGVVSNVLRKVSIGVKGDDYCLGTLKNADAKSAYGPIMFCTREKGKDSCNGDSGGPVVHNEVVVGIVSHGLGACGATAAWNSKLTAFRSWIDQKLLEGPRDLPPEAKKQFQNSIIEARSASLLQQPKQEPEPEQAYIDLPDNLNVEISEDVDVTCNIVVHPATLAKGPFPIVIFWRRVDDIDFYRESNELKLENVSLSDAGTYICHADMGSDGESTLISKQMQLNVLHKPGPATILPDKPIAVQGSTLKLQCLSEPEGYPEPKYIWKKTGSDQILATTRELTIAPVKQSSLGTYTCQATNDLGNGAIAYVKVKVVMPLQVVKPLASGNQRTMGERNFSMVCAAAGNPRPVVTWFKDGKLIDPESDIYQVVNHIYNLDGKSFVTASKLVFQGEQRSEYNELEIWDRGNYSCVFENEAEKKVTKRELMIREKPRTDPIVTCSSFHDNKLYQHPTDCKKFIQCNHGRPLVRDCAPGTAFNPSARLCDFLERAGCERYNNIKKEKVEEDLRDVEVIRSAVASARSAGQFNTSRTSKCALPTLPANFTEAAAYFGTQNSSRIEYESPRPISGARFQISLSFKTLSADGVLFFTFDSANNGFVAIFLKGGRVHASFNNGGYLELTSPSVYNDNEWHNVSFVRENQNGKLVLDAGVVDEGETVHTTAFIRPAGIVFLGGVRSTVFQQATAIMQGMSQSLRGCIRTFTVNNQSLTQPRLSEGISPCPERGSFFPVNGGYLKTPQPINVGVNFTVSIQIKPRTTAGVLLATSGIADYFVLQLINGSVVLTVNNGQGPFTSIYTPLDPYSLCDGNWHTIEVAKRRNVAFLSVDSTFAEMAIGPEESKETNTVKPLHIGGHPFKVGSFGIQTSQKYVGCIRNLSINQQLRDRAGLETVGNVPSDCPTT